MTEPTSKPANWKARGAFSLAVLAAGIGVYLSPSEGGRILKPYLDSAGIPTACMGIIGPEVTRRYKAKIEFTNDECQAMEDAYLAKMVNVMKACVPKSVVDEMTYGEWMAWGHWTYNKGNGAFCNSGTGKLLQRGDHEGACLAMGQWTWQTRGASLGVPKGKHTPVSRPDGKIVAYRMQCRDKLNRCGGLATRADNEVNMCLEALP